MQHDRKSISTAELGASLSAWHYKLLVRFPPVRLKESRRPVPVSLCLERQITWFYFIIFSFRFVMKSVFHFLLLGSGRRVDLSDVNFEFQVYFQPSERTGDVLSASCNSFKLIIMRGYLDSCHFLSESCETCRFHDVCGHYSSKPWSQSEGL